LALQLENKGTKRRLLAWRALATMIAKQNLAPQDSQNEYFQIEMRTFGCKLPATKNEGMAEAHHGSR